MPVVFNFVVINGTGTAWSNQQTVNRQGSLNFLMGPPSDETEVNKVESLFYGPNGENLLWSGSWAPVFDAPGTAQTNASGSPIVSGTVNWAVPSFNTSVFVNGYGWINCPQVNWTATLTWTSTVSGNILTQNPLGSIKHTITQPTP